MMHYVVAFAGTLNEIIDSELVEILVGLRLLVLDDVVAGLVINHDLDGFVPHLDVSAGVQNVVDVWFVCKLEARALLYLKAKSAIFLRAVGKRNFFRVQSAHFLQGDNFVPLKLCANFESWISYKQHHIRLL